MNVAALVDSIEQQTAPSLAKRVYVIDNANEPAAFAALTAKYADVEYVNAGGNVGLGKGHGRVMSRLESNMPDESIGMAA